MRSHLEEQVADLLDQMKVPYQYESEKLPYLIEANYIPDFKVGDIYLEAKGYWSPADRRKILAVKKDNPDMDLRMVFQAPFNKINKNSKTTYAMFCEKHDIPWSAYHNIPLEWLI